MFTFFKGRVALYAILKAMGVGPGDEIILPAFTCVVVPNAIMYLGALPVYVDINPVTYNISPEAIEDGRERIWKPGKAKAIIAQHTYGIPSDMDRILEIAQKYNLYVIEDSCHAIRSKYKGKEVGTFGDAAFFSSQWSKPVTTGLGGWAVMNNRLEIKMGEIYREFTSPSLRDTAILKLQYFMYSRFFSPSLFWFARNSYRTLSKLGVAIGSSSEEELDCRMPEGYKKKMLTWQKRLLDKLLDEVDKTVDHRKWVVALYESLFKEKGIETAKIPEEYEPVFLRYPVMVGNKDAVIKEAEEKRIELGDWFLSPVHPNIDGWEKAGYREKSCPIAEKICRHIINLPTHLKIDEKEVIKIVNLVGNYL